MSKATFHIVYDGSALKDNEINAKSLASALLAIAEIFEEADRVLNHGRTKSEVNIKASFKTGSFKIDFVTVQSFLQNLQKFLISDTAQAALNSIEILTAVSTCVGIIKFLGKKKVTKIEPINNKNIRIYREDDQYIEVEKRVLELYNNIKIRENLNEAIAKPLAKDGYDEFAIISEDKILEQVKKEEGILFVKPEIQNEEISTKEFEHVYSIVSVIFKKDNKWRLFDGNNEINAIIKDSDFLYGIENGSISFSMGDRLFCQVRITQFETDKGLKSEYEILKIKRHIKRPEQLNFFNTHNL